MIERYTLPRMGKIWQDENRFAKMLDIEILVCEVLAKKGKVPKQALGEIKKKARFNLKRIKEIEKQTRHDVIAFLTNVEENVGAAARYIHVGLTSSDVLDTALAVMLKEAADILIDDLEKLAAVLASKARKYKTTIMVGRSHGIHAEPTTFGLKMALYLEETRRNIERMQRAKERIGFGKISGAVGTYAHLDPSIEEYVCQHLELKPSPISTQILQRDRHAEYLTTIAIIGSSLEKFATEIRNLQKTEVLEAEEPFYKGQKGSSAMPHKRNPIICERITGLARVLRGNAIGAMENINLWHERDISHSSVERVICPDSTILLDYMLHKLIDVLEDLCVYPENMKANLAKTKGLIFSQRIMLELVKKGLSRREAYVLVQQPAMKAWQEVKDFKNLLKQDAKIKKHLSTKEIDECFDLKYYLRNVNSIFKRIKI